MEKFTIDRIRHLEFTVVCVVVIFIVCISIVLLFGEGRSFVRSFTLPKTVDSTRISAVYRDGVLDVRIPKAEDAKPRQIEVKVA